MQDFMVNCMSALDGDAAYDQLTQCFKDFEKLSNEERKSFLSATSQFHPNNKPKKRIGKCTCGFADQDDGDDNESSESDDLGIGEMDGDEDQIADYDRMQSMLYGFKKSGGKETSLQQLQQ